MTKDQRRTLYKTWYNMLRRCNNPTDPAHKRYHDRGIRVSKEWMSFNVFAEDMGVRPDGMSLDRIDNDGNYCKDNCRWATQRDQMRNTSRSVFVEFQGRRRLLAEIAEEYGVPLYQLHNRIGELWSVERALSEKVSTTHLRRKILDPNADQIMFRSFSGRELL